MNVEKLTDRLNALVQRTLADSLTLALLWKRRDQGPGAVPILACYDQVVFECDTEQAADTRMWLERAILHTAAQRVVECCDRIQLVRPNRQLAMEPIWYEKSVKEWEAKENRARGE